MPLIWDHIPLFEGTRRVLELKHNPLFLWSFAPSGPQLQSQNPEIGNPGTPKPFRPNYQATNGAEQEEHILARMPPILQG